MLSLVFVLTFISRQTGPSFPNIALESGMTTNFPEWQQGRKASCVNLPNTGNNKSRIRD